METTNLDVYQTVSLKVLMLQPDIIHQVDPPEIDGTQQGRKENRAEVIHFNCQRKCHCFMVPLFDCLMMRKGTIFEFFRNRPAPAVLAA